MVARKWTSKYIVFFFLVVFDPASFYGHHEFELAIAGMFGGFNSTFYQAYHNLIPKAPGFEVRHKLYQLYHYLNHWLVYLTGKSLLAEFGICSMD
jgi:fructosamine-3-kinase